MSSDLRNDQLRYFDDECCDLIYTASKFVVMLLNGAKKNTKADRVEHMLTLHHSWVMKFNR